MNSFDAIKDRLVSEAQALEPRTRTAKEVKALFNEDAWNENVINTVNDYHDDVHRSHERLSHLYDLVTAAEQERVTSRPDPEEFSRKWRIIEERQAERLKADQETNVQIGQLFQELLACLREASVEQGGDTRRTPEQNPPQPMEEPGFWNKS
ncbi:hypothetical protein [Nonomuraea aridisoli]|uniref:Uncharacterized protein n=1 Tax=Nonomuraea aridisoli TaxID=2070368 RepID=A0A2W2E6Z9_9ACTN|nr:hypothetical protein [Nonomuraea aridisoli]PZG20076.1 hypothetical protein C1J01_10380 [Nonomuraea aridisoli]